MSPANGQLGLHKIVQTFKPLFEDAHLRFYGHNIKYELPSSQKLRHRHQPISLFDTVLASYLLSSHSRQHSLEGLTLD